MIRRLLFLLLCFFSLISTVVGSHIRAGEIIAKKINTLTYQFTFYGYRDKDGVLFGQGIFDFGDGTFYGDDSGEDIPWETAKIENLGNGVEKWQFTLVHTYLAPNRYLVSYKESFRNANILNIDASDGTFFYVETEIVIDPLIGANHTPIFTVPPVDQGVVGYKYKHNPGAYDLDGDSLSFRFITPLQAKGRNVGNYRTLIDESFYDDYAKGNQDKNGSPTLSINPYNGTITWDSPGGKLIEPKRNGEFNVAFIVEEWRKINRKWIKLGHVERDMQIIIWKYENKPPKISVPDDTCVVVGSRLQKEITASDPDGDQVKIEAFGGSVFLPRFGAKITPSPPSFRSSPATSRFEWQTNCNFVRTSPYQVLFKVSDLPNVSFIRNPTGISDFQTWNIQAVGPKPTGLTGSALSRRSIALNWDPYSCLNANKIRVWRRIGSYDYAPDCQPGVPPNADYNLVARLPATENRWTDKNLKPGANYCYRIVAVFPDPGGGESLVSDEFCQNLKVEIPLILNVDTKKTDLSRGEIFVKWTSPLEIDTSLYPPDYSYSLLRSIGLSSNSKSLQEKRVSFQQSDTFYVDTALNTQKNIHFYRVILHDKNNNAIDTSAQASSVKIFIKSNTNSIVLNWDQATPWSNNSRKYPYHFIYRNNAFPNKKDSLTLIDSVNVLNGEFDYTDSGTFNGLSLKEGVDYCYYVKTQGSYENPSVVEPLINRSQIGCTQLNDTLPPCPPTSIRFDLSPEFDCEANMKDKDCDFNNFKTKLEWSSKVASGCDDDVLYYEIHYSIDQEKFTNSTVVGVTTQKSFIHDNLPFYMGCYKILAVDKSENKSPLSDIICKDNCPNIVFSNFFSPDGDGINDFYRPFYSGAKIQKNIPDFSNSNCPRFVESIDFKVFTRSGNEIYSYNSLDNDGDVLINWTGKNKKGKDLPTGTYYYEATVEFITLKKTDQIKNYKGWITLMK